MDADPPVYGVKIACRFTVMVALARDGMTMLCVTHEMGFAREVADEVVFMDGGRILDRATARDFFGGPGHPRSRLFLETILKH